MLNLIKRIWHDGEVVNAEKMNTISGDLSTIEGALNNSAVRGDISQTAQTEAWKAQARENIGAGASNRNLLDNPWFTVNQRGVTDFPQNGYGVDRWKLNNVATGSVKFNASNHSLEWISSAAPYQLVEDYASLLGKTLTISWNALTNDSIRVRIYNGSSYPVDQTQSGIGIHSVTFTMSNSASQMQVSFTATANGASIDKVKLELGSVSSLANDAPPNYAEELLKCQRYAYRLDFEGAIAYAAGNTALDSQLFVIPVEMRNAQQVETVISQPKYRRASDWIDAPTHGIVFKTNNKFVIRINPMSGSSFTIGNMYQISGTILLSADL